MKTKHLLMLLAIVMLAACKSAGNYEPINNADTTAKTQTDTVADAKLVKTATLDFKVKDVQNVSESVSSLTTGFGGIVMHHHMASNVEASKDERLSSDSVMRISSIRTSAEMEVKVPSDKLEDYMTRVSRMGIYVTERRMDIDDKSLDYLAEQLKLQSRMQIVSQQKQGKVVIKNPAAVMGLKDDMIDQKINNMKIDQAVKYSVVDLRFFQSNRIAREVVANDNPSDYTISFAARFKMALVNGLIIFQDLIIGLVNLWLLIVAGIAVWLGISYYRKRSRKPLPQM